MSSSDRSRDLKWLVVVSTISSYGNGVLRPALSSLVSQSAGRHEQGVVLGLNQSLNSVAQIIAPIVGGILIGREQLTMWAWVAAGAAFIGLLGARWGSSLVVPTCARAAPGLGTSAVQSPITHVSRDEHWGLHRPQWLVSLDRSTHSPSQTSIEFAQIPVHHGAGTSRKRTACPLVADSHERARRPPRIAQHRRCCLADARSIPGIRRDRHAALAREPDIDVRSARRQRSSASSPSAIARAGSAWVIERSRAPCPRPVRTCCARTTCETVRRRRAPSRSRVRARGPARACSRALRRAAHEQKTFSCERIAESASAASCRTSALRARSSTLRSSERRSVARAGRARSVDCACSSAFDEACPSNGASRSSDTDGGALLAITASGAALDTGATLAVRLGCRPPSSPDRESPRRLPAARRA